MADLNAMLAADARGEHTQEQFDEFMSEVRRHVPGQPAEPRGARRLAGPPGRSGRADDALADAAAARGAGQPDGRRAGGHGPGARDVAAERGAAVPPSGPRLAQPGADAAATSRWAPATRPARCRTSPTSTSSSRRWARTTRAPASRTSTRRRSAGRSAGGAADDLRELRRLERELEEQGYLNRSGDRLDLTAKAVRRLGQTALRHVFADLRSAGRGGHDVPDAGQAGELTGASRPWQFGDEQPLDVVRTLTNAVRAGRVAPRRRLDARWRPRTSRSPRPTGVRRPRSACSSTCPTRWCCATPGARRRPPRWRCTRW